MSDRAAAGPHRSHAPAPVPARPTLQNLQRTAPTCRACDLWEPATQVVLGEGPQNARVMMVGEQPGDREDREGRPFVGPAGRILADALERAELAREEVYMTNAVKHFRYELRGKRRIHERPDRWQVSACLPWLRAELSIVQPEVLICLGATAAQALLGSGVRVGRDHGQVLPSDLAPRVTLSAHPSSVLRMRSSEEREEAMEMLVSDLRTAASWLR